MEDKKGAEQLFIHAERNQDIEVENDETHWVGHDRTKTIDHDETVHVKHDRTETVDNNETMSAGSASPLQTMRFRLVQETTSSSCRKACSIDGTKCSVSTPSRLISATSFAGSRWSPGAATTKRAPLITPPFHGGNRGSSPLGDATSCSSVPAMDERVDDRKVVEAIGRSPA